MSKCKNCGKELVCDVPITIELDGRPVNGFQSAPHGCPPQYDHSTWKTDDLGIKREDLEALFDSVEKSDVH